MASDYRLPPAHRRKLRRIRALVEAASSNADRPADGSPTPEALAEAEEYLATHASCEAYLLSLASGGSSAAPPRCAQGLGRKSKVSTPTQTRKCPICKKQKSALSFDDESGTCIKCKYKALDARKGKKKDSSGGKKVAATKTRKCPVCLQSVTVTLVGVDWVIESHLKGQGEGRSECRASGTVAFRQKRDAMDHTVPGSFEGGKRR